MRLQQVLDILRLLAPEHLAEPWDKPGLQLGDPAWRVRRAMLCIDATEPVLAEAVAGNADMIVAYHPPIFQPVDAVTSLDVRQRIILTAARRQIALYSPHTALDAAAGGVNDWLAEGLGTGTSRPIRPASAPGGAQYKLVVFVPAAHADTIRTALATAGAGRIGDYEQCSFAVGGEGTFCGGPDTQPTIGARGRFERVPELRMELMCPGNCLAAAIAALREVHPYEEPAFDLYRLEPPPGEVDGSAGQGRIVSLDAPVSLSALVGRIKKRLGVQHLEVAAPAGRRRHIKRVGLCAGAGGSLLAEAGDVDAFFTGEMRHHDVLAAQAAGTAVILAGHTQTERPYLKVYRRRIIAAGGRGIDWKISRTDRPPSTLR